MSDSHLLYHVENNTAHITINREKQRNALSINAIRLFLDYFDRAEADENVRVIEIKGAGEKAFCTGADLGRAINAEDKASAYRDYANLLKRISKCPKPTVAKVKGFCLAGGMGLMLACDIVIAGENSKFGTPEVNVGLFPMMIGALIYRNVLRKQALEMVLSGRMLTAEEAQAMGLITRTAPPEELDEEVNRTLAALAAKSPIGMKIGKEAFYQMADMPFEDAVDFLAGKLEKISATEDSREGIRAFMEKRPPVFTGR